MPHLGKSSHTHQSCFRRPADKERLAGKILIKKRVKIITQRNFSAYGRLLDTPKTKPNLTIGFIPGTGCWKIPGETEIAVCSSEGTNRPIQAMERHFHTPEIFIVVEGKMILGLAREEHRRSRQTHPVAEDVEFFLVREGQGIIMRPGLWHIVFVPRSVRRCSFYIIFAKNSAKQDWFMRPFRHGKRVLPYGGEKKVGPA